MSEKGARAENELLRFIWEKGWACMRSAGSGHNSLSPDLIAVKDKKIISIECKAREGSNLYIERDQYNAMAEWLDRTDSLVYVGWRINQKGWFFIMLSELHATDKGFSISKKEAIKIGRRLEHVLEGEPDVHYSASMVIGVTEDSYEAKPILTTFSPFRSQKRNN